MPKNRETGLKANIPQIPREIAVIRVIGSAVGFALKSGRKPDVRNLPVWFDERGKETMRCYVAPAIFPRLNLNS